MKMRASVHLQRQSAQGGVLLVILAILLLGAAITAGWISTTYAEAGYVEAQATGAQRRLDFWTCDALTRQFLLGTLSVATGPTTQTTINNFPRSGDSIVVDAIGAAPLEAGGFPPVNHFNPGNGLKYYLPVAVTFNVTSPGTGAAAGFSRNYWLQSQALALSGDLFIGSNPGSGVTAAVGALSVPGRAMLWTPQTPNTYSLTLSGNYNTPNVVPPPATATFTGKVVSNMPFVPMVSGRVGTAPDFTGLMNVIANSDNLNSLTEMASSALNLTATSENYDPEDPVWDLDPGDPNYPPAGATQREGITANDSGDVIIDLGDGALRNVTITGKSTVTFLGQTGQAFTDADAHIAIVVVVNQTTPITVDLAGQNNRKLTFGIKGPTGTTINKTGSGLFWRTVFLLENTPVSFNGSIGIQGGIQSNRSISVAGSVSLQSEPEPRLTELLVPRYLWVEGYGE